MDEDEEDKYGEMKSQCNDLLSDINQSRSEIGLELLPSHRSNNSSKSKKSKASSNRGKKGKKGDGANAEEDEGEGMCISQFYKQMEKINDEVEISLNSSDLTDTPTSSPKSEKSTEPDKDI